MGQFKGSTQPSADLTISSFEIDSEIDEVTEADRLVFKKSEPSYELEELLAQTKGEALTLDSEEIDWLHDEPLGKEH
jgi:hypothetical protein